MLGKLDYRTSAQKQLVVGASGAGSRVETDRRWNGVGVGTIYRVAVEGSKIPQEGF